MPKITEIKHNLNKPDQTFECNLVRHEGDRILISYVSDQSYQLLDMLVPSGTLTLAYYQVGLPYIIWQWTGPDGQLIGYYVHICDDVHITETHVEYRDLILDVWFFPDGTHHVMDEDELEEALAKNQLDEATAETARQTAETVMGEFSSIQAIIGRLTN